MHTKKILKQLLAVFQIQQLKATMLVELLEEHMETLPDQHQIQFVQVGKLVESLDSKQINQVLLIA